MFRKYYLALGHQLVRNGILDDPEDIFYLSQEQVEQVCNGTVGDGLDARAEVAKHKQDMDQCRDVHLPSVIYGDTPPAVCQPNAKIMPGVSVSLGSYTGKTCVVRDENDFQKLKQGEVLVIPYSDVSWAPLFARAGALISESGGMLSHGSIVAREYNIPAIVSVDQATTLPDGILVTVNAHQGIVQVLEDRL
jgi:pyruvate,water dikinase